MTTTEATPALRQRSDRLPLLVTGLALLAWTTYAYLTIRIDGDILAEAIQVQQWLDSPFWVLSYPGQLHGGVLEYPLIMLAETVAPANVYAFTLVRIVYVPITGLLTCLIFRRAFPTFSMWPLAVTAVIGPAVLHSMVAIKDLYPLSWLLAVLGGYLAYREMSSPRRPWLLIVAGALAGLGIYEHPTSALLSIPLLAGAVALWSVTIRQAARVLLGLVIGLLPLLAALTLQPGRHVVFQPAEVGPPEVGAAFGLVSGPTAWAQALVPTGWGISHNDLTSLTVPADLQFVLNSWLALLILVGLLAALPFVLRSLRAGQHSPLGFLAVVWGAVAVMVVVLVVVVTPVFFYGAGLSFLVLLSVGVIPQAVPRRFGWPTLAVVWVLMAVTSLGAFLWQQPKFLDGAEFKRAQVAQVEQVADAIAAAGIRYVYGSYWEVLPIAYESDGALYPLTPFDSRFPVPADAGERITVALTPGTVALPVGLDRWITAEDAQARAEENCVVLSDVTPLLPEGIVAYSCPTEMFRAAT